MKFGVFYEHQIPRPWQEGDELRLFQEALDQVELADRLGIDYAWEVEHHFLEEYSHSSAPEVFLAACSQRTKNIRLGHGIVLMPPAYNPPARVAERIATLDLVSGGRVEWGTGESAAAAELGGFGVAVDDKRAMWAEAVEQTANMMAMNPYPGFQGQYFSMPCRNVVPKPVQRPHPPLWVACSKRETIHMAARNGIGALTFAFVDPEEATKWVSEYYDIIKSEECVPIGHAVNANIAMVTGFSCHPDEDEAKARGLDGFRFLGHGHLLTLCCGDGRFHLRYRVAQRRVRHDLVFHEHGGPTDVPWRQHQSKRARKHAHFRPRNVRDSVRTPLFAPSDLILREPHTEHAHHQTADRGGTALDDRGVHHPRGLEHVTQVDTKTAKTLKYKSHAEIPPPSRPFAVHSGAHSAWVRTSSRTRAAVQPRRRRYEAS